MGNRQYCCQCCILLLSLCCCQCPISLSSLGYCRCHTVLDGLVGVVVIIASLSWVIVASLLFQVPLYCVVVALLLLSWAIVDVLNGCGVVGVLGGHCVVMSSSHCVICGVTSI
jgi:hypothetical protein